MQTRLVRSLPWRAVFCFLLAAALQTAASVSAISLSGHLPGAQIFCLLPLSRTTGPVRANFFLCGVRSGVHAESFFLHAASGHFPPAARADFLSFWLCMKTCEWRIFYLVNSRGAHADFFYLFCPVTSSLLSARRFSWTFLICPRTSHACVSGAPTFFLSSHFQQLRANLNFFSSVVSGSRTTLVRTS
jgi:hypothetical protein